MADWTDRARRLRRDLQRDFPGIESRARDPEDLAPDDRAPVPDVVMLDRRELRPQLFDYQSELAANLASLSRESALLALPTGAGKTRTAVAAVLAGIGGDLVRRAVWLAPSIELVDQAFETFQRLWLHQGDVERILISRQPTVPEADMPTVLLTTPQAVYLRSKGRRTARQCDVVIFDEAHQLGARTFREAVRWLREQASSGARPTALIGLSATPGRVDPNETEDLVDLFGGNLLHSRPLSPNPVRVLQRRGVLARLRFRSLARSEIDPSDEATRLTVAARVCQKLVDSGRRPLVFTASVAGAVVLGEALRSVGVRAEEVHAGMSRDRRRSLIEGFASGRIDVLTNQRLLSTGYDCPAISDVLILGKVGSPILFEQIVGRAARGPATGGSSVATVWDFDDHLALHGLPQSYYRYRDFDWSA